MKKTAALDKYLLNFVKGAWRNGFTVSKSGVHVAKRGRMELYLFTNESDFGMVKVFDKHRCVATIQHFNWNLVGQIRSTPSLRYTYTDTEGVIVMNTLGFFSRPNYEYLRDKLGSPTGSAIDAMLEIRD